MFFHMRLLYAFRSIQRPRVCRSVADSAAKLPLDVHPPCVADLVLGAVVAFSHAKVVAGASFFPLQEFLHGSFCYPADDAVSAPAELAKRRANLVAS